MNLKMPESLNSFPISHVVHLRLYSGSLPTAVSAGCFISFEFMSPLVMMVVSHSISLSILGSEDFIFCIAGLLNHSVLSVARSIPLRSKCESGDESPTLKSLHQS